jgi:heptosyltransferase-2
VSQPLAECTSVAVWSPGPLGDLVMATPALALLVRTLPDAAVTVYTPPPAVELLEGFPGVSAVVARERRVGAMAARLCAAGHDAVVLLAGSPRSALIAWRSRARVRAGHGGGLRRLLLTHPLPRRRGRRPLEPAPMVEIYLEMLADLGIDTTEPPPVQLPVTAADEAAAQAILAGWEGWEGKVIAVSPGAAYGPAKRWPVARFAEVMRDLAAESELDARFIVLSAPTEGQLVAELVERAGIPDERVLAGLVPLGATRAILARAALHLTNDTGSRHIGHAVGTPTISILGPTHVEWSSYPGQHGELMRVDVECGPCMRRVCPLGHHRCMVEVTSESVVVAARRLLESP